MTPQFKKLLRWLGGAICVSAVLEWCDYWLVGTSLGKPLFSISVWKLRDGGTTGYIGLGYSITKHQKIGGEHGPEICYWFTPFTIYRTTQRAGIRWLLSSDSERMEPIYQGSSLSQWIGIWYRGFSGEHATPEEKAAAEMAIRAMGTNCIPHLLSWLSADHPDINGRSTAQTVFQILGEQAQPAAPVLIQLMKHRDKEIRGYTLGCLLAIKPEKAILVPALVQLMRDPDKNIAYRAATALVELDPAAAEKTGVLTRFPEFQ